MKIDAFKLCSKCHRRLTRPSEEVCPRCAYQAQYAWMLTQDPDNQDWEFAHCEECGSSLDGNGDCPNRNCGNSPYVGTNWV